MTCPTAIVQISHFSPFEGMPASLGPGLRTASGAISEARWNRAIAVPSVSATENVWLPLRRERVGFRQRRGAGRESQTGHVRPCESRRTVEIWHPLRRERAGVRVGSRQHCGADREALNDLESVLKNRFRVRRHVMSPTPHPGPLPRERELVLGGVTLVPTSTVSSARIVW
jgi:hypothetical protein